MVSTEPIVLCVDDERSVLSAVRRLLWFEPYRLVTVQTAQEALDWLRNTDVRVLIVDQRMPEMTGTQLLDAAREIAPDIGRVMLTAWPDRDVIRKRMNNEIDEIVTKPWNERDLKHRIRRLLEREQELPGDSVSIDCHGKTTDDLFWEIMPLLRASAADHTILTLTLQNGSALQGDMMKFLRELRSRAVEVGAHFEVVA